MADEVQVRKWMFLMALRDALLPAEFDKPGLSLPKGPPKPTKPRRAGVDLAG